MRIVFIGPPGAGKGTQSSRLAKFLGVPHLSTGNILRSAKQAGTEIGKIVGPIMDVGKLVSDDLIVGVVIERVAQDDCVNGYLLDGFPRTVPQAVSWYIHMQETQSSIDHVIELRVPDKELVKRLTNRYQQLESPRPDDKPEAIPKRLKVYHDDTSPLLDFYAEAPFHDLVKVIDGIGTMDEVFERILKSIGRCNQDA